MKQVLQNFKTGELKITDIPAPVARPGFVVVQNAYSVVSAGTERHALEFAHKNILDKARARPDLVRKVLNYARTDGVVTAYQLAMARLDDWRPLGYSSVGRVIEIGQRVTDLAVGDWVACAGAGYANHAEVIAVPRNLVARIPQGVDVKHAAFATLGAIAMQGIRRASLTPGESVIVIGLGLIGQIAALILKQYGFNVLGIDVNPRQVERTKHLGIRALTLDEDVRGAAKEISGGYGVDAVIVTAATADSQPIELAGELCRERGRVSVVGLVGLNVPRELYYKKELDLVVSRSYGPGRYDPTYEEKGIDYPISYARWTENRNMQEFLRLLAGGLDLAPLITHIKPIDDAADVYAMLWHNPRREYFLGVLFEYAPQVNLATRIELKSEKRETKSQIRLGIIGAGNFARATLLPALRKIANVSIRGIGSATGRTAEAEARASGAVYCTSRAEDILDDAEIDTVIIATRHNLHAALVCQALARGKNVFVEKPLALNRDELRQVMQAAQASDRLLMVGYNRRFSTHSIAVKNWLSKLSKPYIMHYRVNAGFIEPNVWVHDPEEGGGRIIGEVCHFIDLLQFFAGAAPVEVFANAVAGDSDAARLRDNLTIAIRFADGSIGNIVYTALGSRAMPKEYIEIFAGGSSLVIDNFKSATRYDGTAHKQGGWMQDKGHATMLKEFLGAIQAGTPSPIALDELALTSLATFAVVEAVEMGKPVSVSLVSEL
jgi:predicted dehydrogenase/threonine dehydrogenase-like Zn-dependent dehydrogenase